MPKQSIYTLRALLCLGFIGIERWLIQQREERLYLTLIHGGTRSTPFKPLDSERMWVV